MPINEPIVLKFQRTGSSYARANEVASWMGLTIEAYLLKCIEDGHKLHQTRMAEELELPACLRRQKDYAPTLLRKT
ncbi:hypothetical protein BEN30_15050 [Magnetovibrio blakemorei]|uniref:DNA-binding protein n=1 Tax=Magnetovibrio blakemorei TaxID=28181 RepID=A0A1E5Q4V0_9PROT|nr:hypothetical protein BEN30_15050 [Magnetovibrio blakemorei]